MPIGEVEFLRLAGLRPDLCHGFTLPSPFLLNENSPFLLNRLDLFFFIGVLILGSSSTKSILFESCFRIDFFFYILENISSFGEVLTFILSRAYLLALRTLVNCLGKTLASLSVKNYPLFLILTLSTLGLSDSEKSPSSDLSVPVRTLCMLWLLKGV